MTVATQSDLTAAQRAHIRRVLWLLLAYAVVLPAAVWLRTTRPLSETSILVLAIAASLPCLGFIASWGRYLSQERDEYHLSIVLRRIAIATNATMGAAVVWGFLQAFGIMSLVEAYWIPAVWVLMQGFSVLIALVSRGRHGA